MLKRMIRWRLAAFEKRYGYDAGYAHELLAADTRALVAMSRVTAMSRYRRDVPRDAWYAAKVVGAMHEDCGPCTQLVVRMAEQEAVEPRSLSAVVAGDEAAMNEGVRLAYRFARASLAHDLAADPLRDEVVARWGPRGLASLALALAAARVYPTVKYALGHGRSCARVVVAGEPIAPRGVDVAEATAS